MNILLKPFSSYYFTFVQKMLFHSNALQTDFITEANTMIPDQIAPKESSLIGIHIVCNKGNQST